MKILSTANQSYSAKLMEAWLGNYSAALRLIEDFADKSAACGDDYHRSFERTYQRFAERRRFPNAIAERRN